MKARKWLIILLAIIVATMSTATYTGVTTSLFTDDEQSTDDALSIRWGLTLLDDGFEGTPWDANWNENGTTNWQQDSLQFQTGTYSARGRETESGYLTSDDLDAASSISITVYFWFRPSTIETGDIFFQSFNGSTWNTLYDLTSYPSYVNNEWCEFSETITDSQYFFSGFRIRFNNTGMADGDDAVWIDDVLIKTNQ